MTLSVSLLLYKCYQVRDDLNTMAKMFHFFDTVHLACWLASLRLHTFIAHVSG